MGCRLSKALCREYGAPRLTMPIHHGDTVRVTTGKYKDEPPSKVVRVHRKKYRVYIENVQREKANGAMVKVPVAYSNCIITKLKMDPSRELKLKRKVRLKLRGRKAMGLVPFPTKDPKKKKEEDARVDLD